MMSFINANASFAQPVTKETLNSFLAHATNAARISDKDPAAKQKAIDDTLFFLENIKMPYAHDWESTLILAALPYGKNWDSTELDLFFSRGKTLREIFEKIRPLDFTRTDLPCLTTGKNTNDYGSGYRYEPTTDGLAFAKQQNKFKCSITGAASTAVAKGGHASLVKFKDAFPTADINMPTGYWKYGSITEKLLHHIVEGTNSKEIANLKAEGLEFNRPYSSVKWVEQAVERYSLDRSDGYTVDDKLASLMCFENHTRCATACRSILVAFPEFQTDFPLLPSIVTYDGENIDMGLLKKSKHCAQIAKNDLKKFPDQAERLKLMAFSAGNLEFAKWIIEQSK